MKGTNVHSFMSVTIGFISVAATLIIIINFQSSIASAGSETQHKESFRKFIGDINNTCRGDYSQISTSFNIGEEMNIKIDGTEAKLESNDEKILERLEISACQKVEGYTEITDPNSMSMMVETEEETSDTKPVAKLSVG
ncbi:MAG: hypothetical protein V5A72_03015 [Candidatus Nanohaloarchaea archaeon]